MELLARWVQINYPSRLFWRLIYLSYAKCWFVPYLTCNGVFFCYSGLPLDIVEIFPKWRERERERERERLFTTRVV